MLYNIFIMSAEEVLKNSERSATTNRQGPDSQIINHVTGEHGRTVLQNLKKHKSLGVIGLVTLVLLTLVVLFSFGNLIPAAILDRLIEATDVQYADAVESKFLVFEQALGNSNVPENTIKRLASNGITVDGSSLIFKGETIAAGDFINKVHSNTELYNAFNAATYDRAAYYYDESAEAVFKKIGTSRNNYSSSSDFNTVMSKLVGDGSNIDISNVGLFEKEDEETGEKYMEYDTVNGGASSKSPAAEFISKVSKNTLAEDGLTATLYATDALNTADTISKEQKASIFFMALMENISKMKAGEGNTAKINEAMNFLYDVKESSVVDVNTGETITTTGSALESPSLYAILAGSQIDGNKVTNYASDRVLKTVENKVGVDTVGEEVKEGNITSTSTKLRGMIGRFLEFFGEEADEDTISSVTEIINSSMMENSFDSINGIYAGEVLVEGAVNVGKELAKASGATAGDAEATKSYAILNDTILALDVEADRMNRSPFDITSKNTFLGSIIYRLGVSVASSRFSSTFNTIGSTMGNIIGTFDNIFSSSTKAEDAGTQYLANFGNCETLGSVGAVGSVGCSEVASFDTSTLNDTFHDEGFISFVEENTTIDESGTRVIKKDSKLADFIKYNNERITPIGVMDGGILNSIVSGSSKLSFVSDIISMVKIWLGASDEEKNMATGKSFVNSSSNSEWETYKYAQRYVSLARATEALRQYDGDVTAYADLKFFEGTENPVVAFLENYYNEIANN